MKLTPKELEVMTLLWASAIPLTLTEMVNVSKHRTWKDSSIHILIKSLVKKGAAVVDVQKPTTTNLAMSYKPAMTIKEYATATIYDLKKAVEPVVTMNFAVLAENISQLGEV
jgi:predicted transcriptional regulator